MKTKEELNALKEEVDTLYKKLSELNEDELGQVTGGTGILIPSGNDIPITKGVTLDVEGGEGSGTSGGGAGILVPQDSTLIIVGDGKLKS